MMATMRSLLELLGLSRTDDTQTGASDGDTATVRKIVDALDQIEPDRARYIAAFSYLLSRVAHADLEITEEETRTMERVIVARSSLPEEQAILVVQIAKSQTKLFGGTENFLVAREFKDLSSREQKLELLDCMYAVSAADEHISTVEDNEIARIATQLGLGRAERTAARSNWRHHLGTLKKD